MSKPTRDVRPKSQKEISNDLISAFDKTAGNPNTTEELNRAEQVSFKGDTTKPFTVGLQDLDNAVQYYFDKVIQPHVIQNGKRIPMPIVYGDAEKWKQIQKDGFYRDKNGKIMAPLLTYKRTGFDRVKNITSKIDANMPRNFGVFQKPYSQRNVYDNFALLNNRIPEKQFYGVVVPDYININYDVVVYTYYIEQMNKIIEAINYAAGSYWGDPERFKFKADIDGYSTIVDLQQSSERIVKSTFSIKMFGYLIPDTIQKDTNFDYSKYSNKTKIIVKENLEN